jgi:hypothetical protein
MKRLRLTPNIPDLRIYRRKATGIAAISVSIRAPERPIWDNGPYDGFPGRPTAQTSKTKRSGNALR